VYRAGRFEDAIRRLEGAVQFLGGDALPVDWAYQAMVHHRLEHRDEACRWLSRMRNHQPSASLDQFWDELEIRLFRGEAEALILDGSIFPPDPFARAVED